MEHRWGKRIAISKSVRLMTHRLVVFEGLLVDLSVSGALIKTCHNVRLLSRLDVFLLPVTRRHWVTVPGYVIRRTNNQIGIEWCELSPKPVCDLLRSHDPQRSAQYPAIEWRDQERIRSFK
ncbi:MAG: PilZ domain-containing protein [Pseudomonadota bacterium]|nr:PilZ domain-containing protein [Pseudomonadota bacterium]